MAIASYSSENGPDLNSILDHGQSLETTKIRLRSPSLSLCHRVNHEVVPGHSTTPVHVHRGSSVFAVLPHVLQPGHQPDLLQPLQGALQTRSRERLLPSAPPEPKLHLRPAALSTAPCSHRGRHSDTDVVLAVWHQG